MGVGWGRRHGVFAEDACMLAFTLVCRDHGLIIPKGLPICGKGATGSGLQLNVGRKKDQRFRHLEQIDERKCVRYFAWPAGFLLGRGLSDRPC
jgi:hypothetical protein